MSGMACNEDDIKCLWPGSATSCSSRARRLLAKHAMWRRVERFGGQERVGQQSEWSFMCVSGHVVKGNTVYKDVRNTNLLVGCHNKY